jgi:hypothetical protein
MAVVGPARIAEHLHTIRKVQADGLLREYEVFGRVELADGFDLAAVLGLQAMKDGPERAVEHVDNLVVVVLDGHLQVEPGELGQMPVRVGVFGAEDGPDLVDALHVGRDGHLLAELGRLRQEDGPTKVVDLEDTGARFGSATLKLGGCVNFSFGQLRLTERTVDLHESIIVQMPPEVLGDARLDTEDSLRHVALHLVK